MLNNETEEIELPVNSINSKDKNNIPRLEDIKKDYKGEDNSFLSTEENRITESNTVDTSQNIRRKKKVRRERKKLDIDENNFDGRRPPSIFSISNGNQIINNNNEENIPSTIETSEQTLEQPKQFEEQLPPEEVNTNDEELQPLNPKEPEVKEEVILRVEPILITSQQILKNYYENFTKISEKRPIIDGVIQEIEKRYQQLNNLSLYYQNKLKTKESDDCKNAALLLKQEIDTLSQDYFSKYRRFNPDEEGIFTERKPFLLESGQHIIEHRFLREKGGLNKYFDENGQLLIQTDPTKKIFTKPEENIFDFSNSDKIALKVTVPTKSVRSSNTTTSKYYKLDIDIRELVFEDHPLMSEEEFYYRKIVDAYYKYQEIKESNKYIYYSQRIRSLQDELQRLRFKKSSLVDVKKPTDDLSYLTKDVKLLEREMAILRNEIKQTRSLLEQEESNEIALVNSIIRNWDLLTKIRKTNGYVVTNIKLGFRQIDQNAKEDASRLQQEIEQELQELQEDMIWNYVLQLIEYREKLISIGEQDHYSLFLISSQKLGPKLPIFDEREERKKIIERISMYRRYPGEPIIIPEILKTEITKETEMPLNEIERRKIMSTLDYNVRLIVNNNFVCKTSYQKLRSDFTICFREIVTVSVYKWPESVALQLVQKGLIFDKVISSVFVPIPGLEKSDVGGNDDVKSLVFTSSSSHVPVWQLQKLGVKPMSSFLTWFRSDIPHPSHFTSGGVKVTVAWGKLDEKSVAEAPKPPINYQHSNKITKSLPTARDLLNLRQITNWMESNNIDPNNPRNTGLLSMLNDMDKADLSSKGFYLAEQDDNLFWFDDFNSSAYHRRLHLLKLRYEVNGRVPFPFIPIDLDQIVPRTVKNYEKMVTNSYSMEAHFSSYVNQVRRAISNNQKTNKTKRLVKSNLHVSQFIREYPLPEFDSSLSALLEIFEEYRPLQPKRKLKEPPTSEIKQCNILVQIIRGYNFPIRIDEDETYRNYRQERLKNASELGLNMQMASRNGGGSNIYDLPNNALNPNSQTKDTINYITMATEKEDQKVIPDRLLSFVAVTFDGKVEKTKPVEGPFPQFNQTLSINLNVPRNDFSPDTLRNFDKELYFDIFDEITIESLRDERDYNSINQRAELRWLGSYSVPFSTLYESGKIVGTFRLKTPPLYLGYKKTIPDSNAYSALTVCISLDPPLPTPEKTEDLVLTGEDPEVYSYCQWWTKVVKRKRYCKKRNIKALASNIEGRATLITRYITPQETPPELQTASEVTRFISLIPMVSDSIAFGNSDVWVGSQDFLDSKAGDVEEHAILLCNYLLHLGRDAYVILGIGVPEGDTAYVLTIENNNTQNNTINTGNQRNQFLRDKLLWLCNPATGEKYLIDDPLCPLKEVHIIFSQNNVWANVQKESQPSKMSFDLNDISKFYPLYSVERDLRKAIAREVLDQKGKVQYKKLLYKKTPQEKALHLEQDIRRTIESKFSGWRYKVTIWDNSLSKSFKELLQDFELSKRLDQPLNEEKHKQLLLTVKESNSINGFPLNFSFTDIEQIITEVRNTMIYDIYESDVKFALAVYVEPYANEVFSVWVYIASIINKKGY
ncbi:hypothetical protein ABK040_014210 [Willaertia magna]